MPQVMINRRIEKGLNWRADERFMKAVAEAEKVVEGRGRILIRPSGTEPLLRIMVEADDEDFAKRLAQGMADALS